MRIMNEQQQRMGAHDKALRMNLDRSVHGTFAEIGAGQEVARWFFHVGGASGTIAKTMSAYDMAVSDAIYGTSDRYVSRKRLESMLDHEYPLLLERLDEKRGDTARFFAYANTVAARSYSRHEEGHGWMGIRFQAEPRSPHSEIIIHVKLFDTVNTHEQETLGLIGVNLIYAANYLRDNPLELIGSLMDGLTRDRVEVDMIKFDGPAFEGVDNRVMSLELVHRGLTDLVMYRADGEAVQAGEVLYKRKLLVLRGSFRPPTNAIKDMLESATAQFSEGTLDADQKPIVLLEMTLNNLLGDRGIDLSDFMSRAEILQTMGSSVLITNRTYFHDVVASLAHYTTNDIGLVLGIPALLELFNEKYYTELSGGILESFGALFKARVRLFIYPSKDPHTGEIITLSTVKVPANVRQLLAYLVENGFVVALKQYDPDHLDIFPHDVLAKIMEGQPDWEKLVPPEVAAVIHERGYFGIPVRPASDR